MVRTWRELRQLRDAGVDRVVPSARDGGRVDVESVQGQGVGLDVGRLATLQREVESSVRQPRLGSARRLYRIVRRAAHKTRDIPSAKPSLIG